MNLESEHITNNSTPNTYNFHAILQNALNKEVTVTASGFVTGGFINKTYWLETSEGKLFLKLNNAAQFPDMLQKEARGLALLQHTNTVSVPQVIAVGLFEDLQYLVLAFIEKGYRNNTYWETFARQIAGLHQVTNATFGLVENNFIGSLPQINTPEVDWLTFFIEQRLMVQAQIALDKGLIDRWLVNKLEALAYKLPSYIDSVKPSLLHGDLWHGNYMINKDGNPMVIDPAVYFGCSEMEIAFTELFGRMDDRFYHAYFEQNPSTEGYELRSDIYNLYPLLVHVNLFGQSYVAGIEQVLSRV